jgi:flagellar hook protein FlgE
MGFAVALSGLKAATSGLEITSNNIANSQTVGFKQSRAQFGDVYANSMGSSANASGKGISVTTIAQQFIQGNIEKTGNSLDMAISGEGFFAMGDLVDPIDQNKATEATSFTRNGAFHLNNVGNVVDDSGRYLLAFKPVGTTVLEGFNLGVKTPLNVSTDQGVPIATSKIDMKLNLNGSSKVPLQTLGFTADKPPIPDPETYNHTTSITTYDSLGNAHIVASYFVKVDPATGAAPNTWNVYTFIDGRPLSPGAQAIAGVPGTPATAATGATLGDITANPPVVPEPTVLVFDDKGALLTGKIDATGNATPGVIVAGVGQDPLTHSGTSVDFGDILFTDLMTKLDSSGNPIVPTTNAANLTISIDFAGSTDFTNPFTINDLKQDGLPVGNLIGLDVNTEGVVFAKYSNGFAKPLGQVALARFANAQSLSKVGTSTWQYTAASGAPIYGAGGDNNFGVVEGSSLENSNVDLSAELVKLIVAQQAYQANSQIVSAEKAVTETILRV